ncbi:MAG: hypothetical protein ABID38_04785 [Candidatus Diapherotrites archaeon]
MIRKLFLIGLLLAAVLIGGCTEPQIPACENYCESLTPDIDCIGKWMATGDYPNCGCEFECDSESSEECKKEGESIPVIANPPKCCAGLELIPPKEAQILGISGYCTAKCGNGICDEIESENNCQQDCAGGGPVPYGECGDGICEQGENTPSYPYYCPEDCGNGISTSPCDTKDYCEIDSDCEYVWFTGGCFDPHKVGECMQELIDSGMRPGEAEPRDGVTCTCENNKCITHG